MHRPYPNVFARYFGSPLAVVILYNFYTFKMMLSKNNTLIDDIKTARKAGFTIEFAYRDNRIFCRNTNKSYGHEDCLLLEHCRHEGMNDPGDASILFLIQCKDGSKGYLSSAYGVYADTDLIDFVLSLRKAEQS